MGYGATSSYAGVTIKVRNTQPARMQAVYIQKCGKSITKTPVPTDTMMWRLVIQGRLVGTATNMDSDRTTLNAANDDKLQHAWVDGIHDGNYICENLAWQDDPNQAAGVTNMPFTLTLLEKKFAGGF